MIPLNDSLEVLLPAAAAAAGQHQIRQRAPLAAAEADRGCRAGAALARGRRALLLDRRAALVQADQEVLGLVGAGGAVHGSTGDITMLHSALYSSDSSQLLFFLFFKTNLRYASASEFAAIRKMPGDIVQGHLTLRKANTQLQ